MLSNVGQQFTSDQAREGLGRILQAAQRAHYFKNAGLLEAIKYSMDPEHYQSDPVLTVRTPSTVGVRPSKVVAQRRCGGATFGDT